MLSISLPASMQKKKRLHNVPVLMHIKALCADEKRHVVHAYRDQDLVSPTVKRLVVITIDLGCQFEAAE